MEMTKLFIYEADILEHIIPRDCNVTDDGMIQFMQSTFENTL